MGERKVEKRKGGANGRQEKRKSVWKRGRWKRIEKGEHIGEEKMEEKRKRKAFGREEGAREETRKSIWKRGRWERIVITYEREGKRESVWKRGR